MKKLLGIIAIALFGVAFSACATTNTTPVSLTSEQSLVSMAYLSSGMLSATNNESTALSFNLADDELEVEQELETVDEYLDLLKVCMENGATNFANISEKASDRVEYQFMIEVIVAGDTYLLYYNVDPASDEISGIFVIDGEEYQIVAYNNLDDKDDFEDDDEDEYEDEYENEDEYEDDDDAYEEDEDMAFTKLTTVTTDGESGATTEEATTTTTEENTSTDTVQPTTAVTTEENVTDPVSSEQKMTLVATNGDNRIEITYKVETEGDETETKFEIESLINGVEKDTSIEIKVERNEYKIEIEDGENQYEFKREVESDGIEYKLEYEVDGVEGEIKVTETTNDLGETVYVYEIEEEGKYKEVEIEEHDDDEDETTETSFKL